MFIFHSTLQFSLPHNNLHAEKIIFLTFFDQINWNNKCDRETVRVTKTELPIIICNKCDEYKTFLIIRNFLLVDSEYFFVIPTLCWITFFSLFFTLSSRVNYADIIHAFTARHIIYLLFFLLLYISNFLNTQHSLYTSRYKKVSRKGNKSYFLHFSTFVSKTQNTKQPRTL